MTYILKIENEDDKNKLVEVANKLGIKYTQSEENLIEEVEDEELAQAIKEGKNSGRVSREEIFKFLEE